MRSVVKLAVILGATVGLSSAAGASLREAAEAFGKGDFAGVLKACAAEAKAGEQGCQNFLGILYAEGKGVKRDPTEAVRWFRLSAMQGNGSAAVNLGSAYETGTGVQKDLEEAKKWFLKAAEQGIAAGQFHLGVVIIETEKDFKQAVKWFRPAAAQGFLPAQLALGLSYETGNGVRQNYVQAAKWYETAAEHGEPRAQSALARLYERGEGVEADPEEALFWYRIALANANDPDRKRDEEAAKRLAARLSKAQIATVDEAVRDWRPQVSEIGKPSRAKRRAAKKKHDQGPELIGNGSGFFVSHAGHIITNNHVVEACAEMRVTDGDKAMPAKILATDADRDLALLQVARPTPTVIFRGGTKLRPGESVVVVGFPFQGILTSDPIVTTGIVSALAGLHDDRRWIQISAPVQPGNSGGPVLDSSGNIIAVVVARLDAIKVARATGTLPENVNFAINGVEAQDFLRAHGVAVETAPLGTDKSIAAVADQALKTTVRLECWK